MTTRDDITVDFDQSPRIAEVAAPSVELTMQDTTDTLRKEEDTFMKGMGHTKLMNASGKENLGGGVSVGITVSLQDTQIAFEARTTPAESGTVTTGSGAPIAETITFEDAAADFVSAGVARGSMVINYTDQSIADVVEVVNLTTLRTKVLVNGIGNTYDSADAYDVFNIIQCDLQGGNLVAVDDLDADLSPVLPTAFTQIVRTSSASATLSEQADVQFASFNGGVTVDLLSSFSGVIFPTGTPRAPVNNFADARTIALSRGFTTFFVTGDATINSGLDFTGFTFIGESKNKSLFTIDASANVTNSEFNNATIQGTLDGGNVLVQCSLLTINFVDGFMEECVLNETITLSGAADAHFLDCFSGVPGLSTPTINMGGSGSGLAMRNYNGGITVTNKSGADAVSIDLASGQIIIADSVTTGVVVIRGVGTWTNRDTYAGGATIVNQLIDGTLVQTLDHSAFDARITIDSVNGVSGTVFPTGTPVQPVDNLTDALTIGNNQGISVFHLHTNETVPIGPDFSDADFEGHQSDVIVTVPAGATATNAKFREIEVTGILTGQSAITDCKMTTLSIEKGTVIHSGWEGTITLTGTSTDVCRFVDCYGAGNPVLAQPTLDLGGDGPVVTIARYAGAVICLNKTGAAAFGIVMEGGILTLNNTITNGPVIIAGIVNVFTDNSAGATVNDIHLTTDQGIADTLLATAVDGVTLTNIYTDLLSMAQGRIVESPSGTFTFYEQDNSTIAFVLTKSGSQRTRS